MIEIRRGDMLAAKADAYVNTVNTMGIMGKGLALQFRRAFPENARQYMAASRREEIEIGQMFVVDEPTLEGPVRVINFPTKRHWRQPSRIEYIEAGLVDLRRVISEADVDVIAIPPLGCGLGGLDWDDVRPRIEAALADLPVRILLYEPAGSPPAAEMVHRSERPRMTRSRAVLIGILDRYLGMGDDASPLVSQKLLYFLKLAGEPLDLNFKAEQYGPYDDAARHLLTELEGHYITGTGDGTGREPIRLLPQAADEARAFLAEHPESEARYDQVARLIEGFESPYSLELLATTHWVGDREGARTPDEAADRVCEWSKRKARIFRADDIAIAWRRLKTQGWLPDSALNN